MRSDGSVEDGGVLWTGVEGWVGRIGGRGSENEGRRKRGINEKYI